MRSLLLLLVVGSSAGLAFYFLRGETQGEMDDRLRQNFTQAVASGELESAVQTYHQLEDAELLNPRDIPLLLEAAKAQEKLKDRAGARAVMEKLARYDVASAHVWLAQDMLEGLQSEGKQINEAAAGQTPEQLRKIEAAFRAKSANVQRAAEEHLSKALRREPENLTAHRLMSRLNYANRRWKQAAENLSRLADENDESRLLLARVYNMDRQYDRALDEAKRLYQTSSARAHDRPDDERSVSLAVAAALMAGKFDEADELLRNSVKHGLTSPQLKTLRSMTYLGRAQVALREGAAGIATCLDNLDSSMSESPVPLESFLLAYQLAFNPTVKPRVKELLNEALARGHAPGLLHRMLGDLAEQEGRTQEAIRHYESACDADPTEAVSRNNLAWLLATGAKPDLNRALGLANEALKLSPNLGRFLDTRGQIMARMGRDKEAISDLVMAVQQMPENIDLHKALAHAYARQNILDLASVHEEKVKVLTAAREERKRSAPLPTPTPETPTPEKKTP